MKKLKNLFKKGQWIAGIIAAVCLALGRIGFIITDTIQKQEQTIERQQVDIDRYLVEVASLRETIAYERLQIDAAIAKTDSILEQRNLLALDGVERLSDLQAEWEAKAESLYSSLRQR